MEKYKRLHRTTMNKIDSVPAVGVYVIAYMGKILYIGKSNQSINDRIISHIYKGDRLGFWLRCMQFDWHNIRLDILEMPDDEDAYWLGEVENRMIRYFNPLFNTQLQL